MEIDNKYTHPVSFTALKIKKNIIKDLPEILKQHEMYLKLAVAPNDEFISKYGTITPAKMLDKVDQNQKDNSLINIVLGYFHFGKNPFSERVAGIAIEKGNKTIIKQPLDFSIKKDNSRVDSFSSSDTFKSDVHSSLFDQFEQAEDLVKQLSTFVPTKKKSGEFDIIGNFHERIVSTIEQSPLISRLRQLHDITIETDFNSIKENGKYCGYQRKFVINWHENKDFAYQIIGEGESMKLADDDAIRKIMQTPLKQVQKELNDKYSIDITTSTLENNPPTLVGRIIEFFE
ncbi:hypothetical protein J6A34_02185 [bacterium]|nr:hypothetical protein [bacterium]